MHHDTHDTYTWCLKVTDLDHPWSLAGVTFHYPPHPQKKKKVTPSLVVGSSTLHRRSLYILARYYSKWLQSNWKNANLAIGASTSCTTTLSHAWDARVFLTWLEQGLHAKANAEERPVLFQVLPGSHRGKPRPFEFFSQPNGSEEIQRYKSAAYKLTDCLHPWKAGMIAIVPRLIPWTAYSFLVSIHQLLWEVQQNEHQIIDWRSSKTSLKIHLMLTSRLLLLRFKFKRRKCCGCITPNLPICQSGPLRIISSTFGTSKVPWSPFVGGHPHKHRRRRPQERSAAWHGGCPQGLARSAPAHP